MTIYTVSTHHDSGKGSLRDAINQANNNSNSTIVFSITGTIKLSSDLPKISKNCIIDGTSAPNYSLEPLIIIDCNCNVGFTFVSTAEGSKIIAIAVINSSCNGVDLYASNITIDRCRISHNYGHGIYVTSSSDNNKIGLNINNISDYVSNKISYNKKSGIFLNRSNGNVIVKNQIINNNNNGITLKHSSRNVIGGTVYTNSEGITNNPTGNKGTIPPVFIVPPLGNQISSNNRNGIELYDNSTQNTFYGNFIGTSFDGNSSQRNLYNGVMIRESNDNVFRGCNIIEEPFVYYNVISGNGCNGMNIKDSNGTIIQGNFFGINAMNNNSVPNQRNGLLINGCSDNTIVGGVIPLGNNVSGNHLNGIYVADKASNFLSFNSFCGLAAFGGVVPNGRNGILITSSGQGNTLRTNVCSGNQKNGIKLAGNANHVNCDPNLCGTATNGTEPLPNQKNGLLICDNAAFNFVGSQTRSVIPNSTFSANGECGIKITGQAHDNVIYDCGIGLATTLTSQLNNNKFAFLLTDEALGNCIFDCYIDGDGVLTEKVTYNKIIGNYIGVDRFHIPFPNDDSKIIDNSVSDTNLIINATI